MLKSFPVLTSPIFALVVLGLALAVFPIVLTLRLPVKYSTGYAAGLWLVSLLAFLVLTLLIAWLYQLLASTVPQLNPYATPRYESVDAGMFSIFVGLLLALPLTIWLQWLVSKLKT